MKLALWTVSSLIDLFILFFNFLFIILSRSLNTLSQSHKFDCYSIQTLGKGWGEGWVGRQNCFAGFSSFSDFFFLTPLPPPPPPPALPLDLSLLDILFLSETWFSLCIFTWNVIFCFFLRTWSCFSWCVKRQVTFTWNCFQKRCRGPSF